MGKKCAVQQVQQQQHTQQQQRAPFKGRGALQWKSGAKRNNNKGEACLLSSLVSAKPSLLAHTARHTFQCGLPFSFGFGMFAKFKLKRVYANEKMNRVAKAKSVEGRKSFKEHNEKENLERKVREVWNKK